MNLKKWLWRAIEILVLGVIIYTLTVFLLQVSPSADAQKVKMLDYAMVTVFFSMISSVGALAFVKLLKGLDYLFPAIIIKLIKRLDKNISILVVIFASVSLPLLGIVCFTSIPTYVYSNIIHEFTKEPKLIPYLVLGWFVTLLLFTMLYISGIPLLFVLIIIYNIAQYFSPKYNRVLATFVFFTSRILNTMGFILFSIVICPIAIMMIYWLFLLLINLIFTIPLSIIMLLNPDYAFTLLNTSPESYSLVLSKMSLEMMIRILFLWVGRILIEYFFVINAAIYSAYTILMMLIMLVNVRLKLKFNKSISNFIWWFVYNLIKFVEFLSTFLIFSTEIQIGILDMGLSYALASDSTPKAATLRKFATKYALKYLNSKKLFSGVSGKYKLVSSIAAKLLLLGDLKQANIIYAELWESAKTQAESGKVEHTFIDYILSEICYYYIETSQYEMLSYLIDYSASLVEKNKLSKMTYIANWMRADFAKNTYSKKTDKSVDECLSWENLFNMLIRLPEILNYSNGVLFLAKAPEDFFKYFLSSLNDSDYSEYEQRFREANREDLINLLETLRLIFVTQSKIYLFISTQDYQWLPTETEVQGTLVKNFTLDMSGIKISVDNSFIKDNIKLLPLVYLLASEHQSLNSWGNERLQQNIDSAQKNGREIELAFLKCCQGKVLINTGSLENGYKTLLTGIKIYEGIRHSVNTDQLGLGFGSSYLEYYDWAIDALLQLGNPKLAFEYTERATARAILDLVSRKTSRSGSVDESNPVAQLISEIQNLDFNIYFSQSATYEDPFFAKFSPNALKRQLERGFYKDKQQILKRLLKQRDALVAKLEALDPVSATLVELKTLEWGTSSEPRESFIPFEALWSSDTISETEAILCFHVIHKLSFAKNKPWDKIVCFVLYRESDHLQLHHHVVDDPQTVSELQAVCQGIANEIKIKKPLKSLALISDNLTIPLLQHLPESYDSLTIAANSDLQFFPWSILYDQESMQLIERFCIRITPSLSLLYLLKQREDFRLTKIPTKFLVAGVEQYPNPREYLFWSGVEVNRISQLYDSPLVLKNADVDQHFANQFKQAEVIHYSGHGNYRQSDSELDALEKTYLCLYNKEISAAQILDGALENPAAKVMILSACLTGRGDLTTSGSEILGLERALFHAGLSSLITTLWSVDEFATALLMLKLHLVWHQHNNTLETLASSLREAQLWLNNLSWRQLKEEFPEISQDVSNCLAAYQTLIIRARENQDESTAKRFEKHTEHYHKIANLLLSESPNKSFRHPYFWAAFQVKGMG